MSLKFGNLIKEFDGKEDFAEWIRKVELVAELQEIENKQKFVPLFLTGGAFAVYESLDAGVKGDYDKLKAALLKAFSLNSFSAFESLVSRSLRHDESVDVYLSDIRRLAKLVTPAVDEAIIRCAFVRGLPESIRMQLQALSSIEKMAMSEVVERSRAMMSFEASTHNSMTFAARATSRSIRHIDTRQCFSCGEIGHIARWCRRNGRINERKSSNARRGGSPSDQQQSKNE